MADAAGRKGFSGRLMGMKFMQRAAQKFGKRKADDALSTTPPEATSEAHEPTPQQPAPPDTDTAPDVMVLLHRGKTRCRVVVQACVHEDQAQLLAGRKSFAQGLVEHEECAPKESIDATAEAQPPAEKQHAQPPPHEEDLPPAKKQRGLSQLLNKHRRR